MSNQAIPQLIQAIATFAREKDAYLSKTKLLKLLYLFDVEYYRRHRRTFTEFSWKFFHLGPWTNEFDPVLDDLVRIGGLVPKQSTHPEYDSINYLPGESIEIDAVLTNIRDEGALKKVLNAWVERPVGEILDHVYFRTEPMENAVRNTPLDFSLVPAEQPVKYARSSSNTSPRDIAKMRQTIAERQRQLKTQQSLSPPFTPPRYDSEFFQAMSKLEETLT